MPDQPQICVRCCPEADGPQTAPGRDSRDFCAFREVRVQDGRAPGSNTRSKRLTFAFR